LDIPRALGLVFIFCAPGLIFGGIEGIRSCFHILRSLTHFRWYRGRQISFSCFARRLFFDGTEGIQSHFHAFRSRTCFRRPRGLRVPFSCFALPDMFSAIPWPSGPIFMFFTSGDVFDETEGVNSRFHVLGSRTHFSWYRGRRVMFSCFDLTDSFSVVWRVSGLIFMFCAPRHISAVLRASGPIFMFCAPGHIFGVTEGVGLNFNFCTPGLVFGGTEGVGSRFHVLHARTHFRRYRRRPIPFSCFPLPYIFLAVPRASGPSFMFCTPGLDFSGTKGVDSRFHVLRFRTRFRQYGGHRLPFSCFISPDSFSAVPRMSGPVFIFGASGLIFGGTEGVGTCFHILCSRTCFRRY
jgi:hypothetical protein